jgi:RND family efflux transporter MFP subunit
MSQPDRPNWILRIVVVLVLLAAAGWGAMFFMREVAVVTPAKLGIALNAVTGTVEVKAEFTEPLKSEVGGRVLTSELDVGKRVHKGDILVQLDTGDVDLEIERIKNDIEAAKKKVEIGSTIKAEYENAQETLAERTRQADAGTFSRAELQKLQRLLDQTKKRLDLDEVNLRLSLDTLENSLKVKERERAKMSIAASENGIITQVYARPGHLINSNSPIADIIATKRTVEAKISEENFASVKEGLKAIVKFLTFGADHYDAVVAKVLPSADPQTQRYQVHLDMVGLPPERVLVPGLTGEVSIIVDERPNAVIIPRRALIGDYVYVVDGSKLVLRKVEKGYSGLNEVEILKGLKVGEQVVVEQQDRFREGDRVRTQALE